MIVWVMIWLLVGCNGRSSQIYHLYYLAPDNNGISQIFSAQFDVERDSVQTEVVTEALTDVVFFAVSPKEMLAYTVQESETDTAVYLADANGKNPLHLLTCPQAVCDQLVWHPDGRRLVYERRELTAMGSPHLWWLDTQTGETVTLLANEKEVGSGAQFSADGEWVSYVAPQTEGMEVFNFADGRRINFFSNTGRAPVWSPVANHLIISDYDLLVLHGNDDENHEGHSHDTVQTVHLFLTEVDPPSQTELGDDLPSDDASPAWSPDGEWLVVGRKVPRTAMGRQLWLMRPDGSEARELTDEPEIHHGVPSWSGDGRFILFQRFPVLEDGGMAAIWLLEVATGEQMEVVGNGRLPVWRQGD